MAGIYIHIPFCRKACHYCNFHFSTSLQYKNEFVTALLKEIDLRTAYLQEEPIETIYFGGGTPSLLEEIELNSIMNYIYRQFNISDNAEITFEANPDDITREKLIIWRRSRINRLSIGVQSFFDDDLKWMNRAHSAQQSTQSILMAQEQGLANLNIDLIYGGPTLNDEKWEANFQRAVTLNIPHLSCYALTVEPKTALEKMIAQHKIENVDSEKQASQFLLLADWATAAGYEQYEISNFAKPGMRSKHNSAYWQGKKYLGLGPSAHSFNGNSRQWNVANNSLYIQSIQKEVLPVEIETLTLIQQMNEYIMTSLRTKEGMDLEFITKRFGPKPVARIVQQAKKYLDDGKISTAGNRIQLTRTGKLFADGIASDLFEEESK